MLKKVLFLIVGFILLCIIILLGINVSIIAKSSNYILDVNVSNEIKIKANTDLVLLGIGFISFKKDTTIITNLDNKNIEIRQSLFGGKND